MKKNLLFFSVLLLLFSSCKKDNPGKNKLLVSKITVSYNQATSTLLFEYDDKNRIIKQSSLNQGIEEQTSRYEYDNNDNLLTATIVKNNSEPVVYSYFYENGMPAYINFSQGNKSGRVATIITSNNKVTGIDYNGQESTVYEYKGGNIEKEINTSYYNVVTTTTNDFDTKNGVFKYSGYKWPLPKAPPYASPNNVIKYYIEISNIEDKAVFGFGVKYNEENYPVKFTINTIGYTASYQYIQAR